LKRVCNSLSLWERAGVRVVAEKEREIRRIFSEKKIRAARLTARPSPDLSQRESEK